VEIDVPLILKVVSLILLAISLVSGCKVVTNVASNIDKFGDAKGKDHWGREVYVKQIEMTKAQNSFWITVATVVVVVIGTLEKISQDLFIVLLIACLGGLGIKLTIETWVTKNIGEFKKEDDRLSKSNS
jgi:hypothetical protein